MSDLDQKSAQKPAEADKKSDNIVLDNVSETKEKLAPEIKKEVLEEVFIEKKVEQKIVPAKVEDIIKINVEVLPDDELSEKTLPEIEQKDQIDNIPELEKAESTPEEKIINIKKDLQEPKVIIKEKIIKKELSEGELENLFQKRLLKYLKNARQARQAFYKNNLKLIADKDSLEKFTPRGVSGELKISQRTASRYLSLLFKQGKIMRFGKGRKVYYQTYSK